ncbi:MAG: hypothetical protein KAH21_05535 [Spirochaetaceae bacterium]|nr:hypothetical protein [Spirochaetaceae bacterium]
MNKYLLGIDIGTSELKAGVIDESGTVLASLQLHNSSSFNENRKTQQDALSIVQNTSKLIKNTCNKAGIEPCEITALGMDGQMGGIIGVNQKFEPLTGFDMGLDLKSELINTEFHQNYQKKLISTSCGSPRNTPKIAWWKQNEPYIYKKVRRFITLNGYVAGVLTGIKGDDAAIDETMISYFGNENAKEKRWSEELTSLWGIDIEKMPRIGKPWEILGNISNAASHETGLTAGTPVVLGAGDQPAGFLGGGFNKPGTLIDIGGSTAMLTLCVNEFIPDIEKQSIMYMPSVSGNNYFATWYINGGDMVIPWFQKNFANNLSLAELSKRAGRIPTGSEGLLFFPYFGGRQCPYQNNLRGSWIGLNLAHTPAHMFRSILEGIAAQVSGGLESLERLFPGRVPSNIVGIGGAAKDDVFTEIKANFSQRNYHVQTGFNASLRGSALIAGIGIGIFNLENIPKPEVKESEYDISPLIEMKQNYKKLRAAYSHIEKRTLEESFNIISQSPF